MRERDWSYIKNFYIYNCYFNWPRGKRKRLSRYQIFLDRGGGGVHLAEAFGAGSD